MTKDKQEQQVKIKTKGTEKKRKTPKLARKYNKVKENKTIL